MDKEKTGQLIKEMRIKKGLTQNQLAAAVGVSNKAVSRWETGNSFPDVALLDSLAAALDIKIEELVLGECQEEAVHSEIIEDLVQEVRKQENKIGRKVVNGLLVAAISVFILLVVAIVFLNLCFWMFQQEANLEEALLTCCFGVIAMGLLLIRFGIPLFGIGISGLLWKNLKKKPKWVKVLLGVVMLLCFVWLGYSIGIVIYNTVVYG